MQRNPLSGWSGTGDIPIKVFMVSVVHDAAATGAGELAKPLSAGGAGVPESPIAPLFSLTALLSSLILVSLEPVLSLLTSSAKTEDFLGARQLGTSQATPVKLRIWKPFRSHFRHGLPLRSRARKPALIAPVLALGPSLGAAAGAAKGPLWFGSLIISPLVGVSGGYNNGAKASCLTQTTRAWRSGGQGMLGGETHIRCFFLGPGLPRGLGTPSTAAALRFAPGLGPGTPLRLAAVGGARRPLLVVLVDTAASGVSAGVGSTAGVSGDDEGGLGFSSDGFGASCGNLARASGDRARTTRMDLGAAMVTACEAGAMGAAVGVQGSEIGCGRRRDASASWLGMATVAVVVVRVGGAKGLALMGCRPLYVLFSCYGTGMLRLRPA